MICTGIATITMVTFSYCFQQFLSLHSPSILDLGFIGVWYRLSDHEAELPSRDQLDYLKEGGIVYLSISSSYADLGGANIDIGHHAFSRCYYGLRKTNILRLSGKGIKHLQSGPLATPAVGIWEAVRFSFQQELVKKALLSGNYIHITSKFSTYFNLWGSFSKAMYTKEVPEECILSIVQISNSLWVIRRQDLVEGDWCSLSHRLFLFCSIYYVSYQIRNPLQSK